MRPHADTTLNACCVATYGHPLAQWLLGESLHPGGLALTTRLATAMGLKKGDVVLDVGSGRGASAVHLAETVGCRVTGLTLEDTGTATGSRLALEKGVSDTVTFLQQDVHEANLEGESYDGIVMECVLSILGDKEAVVCRLAQALAPGGRLGLTDVTVNGELPSHLEGLLATVGCTGNARPLSGYEGILSAAGLHIEQSMDLPQVATEFMDAMLSKLRLAEMAARLGAAPVSYEYVAQARSVLKEVRDLVHRGILSYGMMVASKDKGTRVEGPPGGTK